MNIETQYISIAGLDIKVVRKDIKNLHLGVYPPDGRVRVATPLVVDNDAVRLAVIDKLAWIKRQQANFAAQPRQSPREMVNGETHYFFGRKLQLRVIESNCRATIVTRGQRTLELYVRASSSTEKRRLVLEAWYRDQLRQQLTPLIEKWQRQLKTKSSSWRISKMRTRWGGCNTNQKRVWFNLELAKVPPVCLDYIVLHELAHLLVRNHDDHFLNILNTQMPDWFQRRSLLNKTPIGV